jgi:lipoate-protein ligase A
MHGNLDRAFVQSVKEVIKEEYGEKVFLDIRRPHPNDIVFEVDGKIKKFCGMSDQPKLRTFVASITFKFDPKGLEGLWKLDHKKFVRKVGKIKKIEEVVGGLTELNPKIKEDVVDKIVKRLCDKLNWEAKEGDFDEKENEMIENIKKEVSKDDWVLKAKRVNKNVWPTRNKPNGQ